MGEWWDAYPDAPAAGKATAKAQPAAASWWAEYPDAAAEDDRFPTPGETASTMIGSGLRAIPGMIAGTAKTAYDVAQLVSGDRETGQRYAQESIDHARAAMDPSRSAGDRIGEAVSTIPIAGPMATGLVRQAGRALTPAYTAAISGASKASPREVLGTAAARGLTGGLPGAVSGGIESVLQAGVGGIAPKEMREAAEAGGEGVAALALPGAVKTAGKVASAMTPKSAVRILRFTARASTGDVVGATAQAGKSIVGDFMAKGVGKLSEIAVDSLIAAIKRHDVPGALETIAKAAERSPQVAKVASEVVAKAEGGAPTPYAGPYTGSWDAPRPSRALPPTEPPVTPQAPVAPTGEGFPHILAAQPGNIRIATTFTPPPRLGPPKPKGPLTTAERKRQLDQIRAAQEAGLDIFEVFGIEVPK